MERSGGNATVALVTRCLGWTWMGVLTMKNIKLHENFAATELGVFNVDFENIIPRLPPRSCMTGWNSLEPGTLNVELRSDNLGYTLLQVF